jgi:hypothetical protein
MAGKGINIYVDQDIWKSLKENGFNISDICNKALQDAYNKYNNSSSKIKDQIKKEIENTKLETVEEIDIIKIEKEQKLEKLQEQLKSLNEQEILEKQEQLMKDREKLKPLFIREALKVGISENDKILEYVEKRFKEEEYKIKNTIELEQLEKESPNTPKETKEFLRSLKPDEND